MTTRFYGENILDSREVVVAIEELDDYIQTVNDDPEDTTDLSEEHEELSALKEFARECENSCSDWEYGESLINDDYFVEHAEELAKDIGAVNSDAAWPLNYIDWEAAADALKQDYSYAELDGTKWWFRV